MGVGKRVGYVRVSTPDQNPDRQLEGIPLDKKFVEYASACSLNRPQLMVLMEFVREDDIILIHSMDRLARNLTDLKSLVDLWVSKKIEVHFIKEGLKFNGSDSPMSNLVLSLMGAFAEFELAFIKERQKEGISLAKKRGKYGGRAKTLKGKVFEDFKKRLKEEPNKSEVAREFGISRRSIYKYLIYMREEEEAKLNKVKDAKKKKS